MIKAGVIYKTLVVMICLSFPFNMEAQNELPDSVSTDRRSNQNVMLNMFERKK